MVEETQETGQEKIKVVFLDIDGVLATPSSYGAGRFEVVDGKPQQIENGFMIGDNYFHGLDPRAIKCFNKVIDASSAKIVISSTWRHGTDEYFESLKEYLKVCGVKGEIIGRTPSHRRFSASRYVHYQRGNEIQDWLSEHPEVTHFVVFDDDSDMDAVRDNFVHIPEGWHTSEVQPDGTHAGKGLEDKHVEQAKEILECL